ncbi:MAG: tRNA-2-methylthio-N6-dimethylallyladenosine synthase [Paracoccaceae bacterium]|jgi:tRNA-2-methylthio-N6-dimethylallyladenosine synthase
MSKPKKLFVKTYGCQMNVYDSERMVDAMVADGYETTDQADQADLVLLNTCHIREKAAEKVYSELGRLKKLKTAKPDMKFGVTGCVAQAEGAEIIKRQPLVDIVVGPQAYHRLPEMAKRADDGAKVIDTDFPEEDKFDHLPGRNSARGPRMRRAPSAFLTVQEGCDKFCAFCVVPYTRGAEVSRPTERILSEARDLVERGVAEITLLGQNVNAYLGAADDGDWGLARLIRELAKVDGLERIRFTTSHPNDMQDDLIDAFGDVEKLMPYLHLPVQSGSDKILKAMNRKHTAASYLTVIERIRAASPGLLLSGDFIVGFPGESEADFQDTMALVETVNYGQAYSFKYSPRPGTPAAEKDPVTDVDKSDRLARLQTLLTTQQKAAQDAMVGQIAHVLFEKPGRDPGQLVGKSEHLHAVHADHDTASIGKILPVRITSSGRNSLMGQVI